MGNQGRRSIFPLRLSRTMREQVDQLAHLQGISINEFIMLAVAEKIVRLDPGDVNEEQLPKHEE